MLITPTAPARHTNRLIHQTSPYLLQHAHNPVDWYAWGPDAFAAAKAQDKPIFLSVGYSTCYWCHVMERQCFENEAIAEEMNRRFINIKVDREERPDVDQLYMTAVQVLTRQGGWPMSVFLTPDLRPFYGGTYFPPTDQQGRPGFPTLLRAIDDAYHHRPEDVNQTADQLVNILRQMAEPSPPDAPVTIDDAFVQRLIEQSIGDYDVRHGGFGAAPKFPRETLLELLMTYTSTMAGNPPLRQTKSDDERSRILSMVRRTLDAMANGGIRDQLGGGFHRYSTDSEWLVPHFEIMLYDNAMLAWVYIEAYRQTEDRRYAHIARGILDFILREMTSPQGAFYTAFDAEVDAHEGDPYLWTRQEIESLLPPDDARLFCQIYGVDRGPNFADPHHGTGRPDRSILYLPEPLATVSASLGTDAEALDAQLEKMRQLLYAARRNRKQPLLDRKVLTSWNALTIRALAHAGQTLQEQRYLDAASRAAEFLLTHHRTSDGTLLRASGGGLTDELSSTPSLPAVVVPGFLDDCAFLMQALIALRDASGQDYWKNHAALLAMTMLQKFGTARTPSPITSPSPSPATPLPPSPGTPGEGRGEGLRSSSPGGFYFTATDTSDLIVRQKIGSDSPLPSGNAVAAMAMLALDQPDITRGVLSNFAQQLETNAESMSAMAQAALRYVRHAGPFTVAPTPGVSDADRPLSPQQLAAGVVSVRTEWLSPTQLAIHLSILNGFHINSHETAEGLVPTQLSVADDGAAAVESIEYASGELQSFAFAPSPLRVYSGEVTLAVRFTTPQTGPRPLALILSYQACNDSACLPPITKRLEVPTC